MRLDGLRHCSGGGASGLSRHRVPEVSSQRVEKGLQSIEKDPLRLMEKRTIHAADRDQARGRLHGTPNLEDLKNCDIVIKAIMEQLPAKKQLLGALDTLCSRNTILASNPSSISITEMAVAAERPGRFLGLHFLNPVPVMKLVEVVRTIATATDVFEEVVAFAGKLGKTAVRTLDPTGFVANRLLVPYLVDAIRALEEGIGTIEDIDTACYLANIMFDGFKEKRFTPPLLKRMVIAGWNGRKAGRGFYDYTDPTRPKPV
jgi:3-hydroxybutyryl-CoA dehydrogenase